MARITYVLLFSWLLLHSLCEKLKGYHFLDSVENFYKIQTVAKSWEDAQQICNEDDAIFFYPEHEKEADAVLAYAKETRNVDHIWIGMHATYDRIFKTTDGFLSTEVYNKWVANEPNNANDNEYCVEMHVGGLNEKECSFEKPFICKKTLEVIKGPPGPRGIPGSKGEQGDIGPIGYPGVFISGMPGMPGVPGLIGPMGEPGRQGSQGQKGDQGPFGMPGMPGEPGLIGPMGPPGINGLPGLDGDRGLPGAQGPSGVKGDRGFPGPIGYPGVFISGMPGMPGEPGLIGPMGMPGMPGVPGLIGPMGEPGRQGSQGQKGDQGPFGMPGMPGEPGLIGPMGPPGINGLPGLDGDRGLPGAQGPSGVKGDRGFPGLRGISGPPGNPGTPGMPGVCPTTCPMLYISEAQMNPEGVAPPLGSEEQPSTAICKFIPALADKEVPAPDPYWVMEEEKFPVKCEKETNRTCLILRHNDTKWISENRFSIGHAPEGLWLSKIGLGLSSFNTITQTQLQFLKEQSLSVRQVVRVYFLRTTFESLQLRMLNAFDVPFDKKTSASTPMFYVVEKHDDDTVEVKDETWKYVDLVVIDDAKRLPVIDFYVKHEELGQEDAYISLQLRELCFG